jgi:hypothetical protein
VTGGIDLTVSIIQGIEPPERFNGMFADIIIDPERKKIIGIG